MPKKKLKGARSQVGWPPGRYEIPLGGMKGWVFDQVGWPPGRVGKPGRLK